MLDIFQTGVVYKVVKAAHGNWSHSHCNWSVTKATMLILTSKIPEIAG